MPTHDYADSQSESVADAVTAMRLEQASSADVNGGPVKTDPDEPNTTTTPPMNGFSSSAVKSSSQSQSPVKKDESEDGAEEKVGGDITLKHEPGQPPKLARSSSKKVVPRPPQLFLDFPDCTSEAKSTFDVLEACIYANKYIGSTDNNAMECDCIAEWDPDLSKNLACGEQDDCINRATRMECLGNGTCGSDCQNQRFQRKEYADVAVIKTEKKGYGLRAEADLRPNQFIFEYVGEVIPETQFRRRMRQYDEQGIKHFYFMSLSPGEFVDATKRGNLGRFCNHSCNPNCYIDKWVVGEKVRMGIFAQRSIEVGEELVFNYNVDRYGTDPQPCYCGEPNCVGFIGGRTQTGRATKLSDATIEALGIEDADDWDTATAKRPRKKKMGEPDEEYVDSVEPKSLDENGVTKVMAALMQCQEKWIAVKLLGRIQRCEDERVRNRVVKMHGYQILNSQLSKWKEDHNVVLQILDILDKFPRLTRNKIIDSKIESTVQQLDGCGDERVEKRAAALLEVWSTLEVGYRIPRMKRDPNAATAVQTINQFERRETTRNDRQRSKSRSRSRSRSLEAPRGPASQSRNHGQRNSHHHGRRQFRRHFDANTLPQGWFAAESNGRVYYYSARGDTTWTKPTTPAPQPPPPPKESRDKALQDIIDGIMNTKESTPKEKTTTPGTPQASQASDKKEGREKWKRYSEEKRKKLYENTLFPHIKHVVDKFKHKLPKDDLKRYAKDVAKKLVDSDFKNNRVDDPTKISDKQQKKVKQFCKEYFDKAVAKHRAHAKKKGDRPSKVPGSKLEDTPNMDSDEAVDVKMSDDEEDKLAVMDDVEGSGGSLKRKRDEIAKGNGYGIGSPVKRARSSTPPPPPPPMTPGGGEEAKLEADIKREDDDLTDSKEAMDTPPSPPPPPPAPENEDDKMQIKTEDDETRPPSAVPKEEDGVELKEMKPVVEGKS